MYNNHIHADLAYLGEVVKSDLTPSAKLFFASLITDPAFLTRFGFSYSDWNAEHRESIRALEEAGFLFAAWDDDRIRYVAHRDWIGKPSSRIQREEMFNA